MIIVSVVWDPGTCYLGPKLRIILGQNSELTGAAVLSEVWGHLPRSLWFGTEFTSLRL